MRAPPLSFSLLSPSVATLSNGKLQVSFPRQVLQPAMLSILHSYLKNVEYQQWLSLVHCQLLYEAILAEWDGSQSRESSAAACTITPLTGRLALFIFPLLHLEQPGAVLPRERLPPESRHEFGAPGVAPGACWQPAVEGVTDGGIEGRRDQSELGECPQSSVQSGRRAVRRGERGRAFRRGCGELCVFYLMLNMFVHLSAVQQWKWSEHTTCCLSVRVWSLPI